MMVRIQQDLKNKGVKVIRGRGSPRKHNYGVQAISHEAEFDDYVHILDSETVKYDVFINEGRCRPQVAYNMRSHLKENGIMILRGSNLAVKNHYSIISSFYTLEKK